MKSVKPGRLITLAAASALAVASLAGCAAGGADKPANQQGQAGDKQTQQNQHAQQQPQKPQPLTHYDPSKVYRMDQIEVLPVGSLVAAEQPEVDITVPESMKISVIVAASEKPEQVAPVKTELERQLGKKVTIHAIPSDGIDKFREILAEKPNLVFTIGTEILGVTDLISTQYPKSSFVTLGGQVAEPTKNVNAVVWPGATSRAAVVTEKMEFGESEKWAKYAVRVGLLAWLNEEPGMVYVLGAKAE